MSEERLWLEEPLSTDEEARRGERPTLFKL